MFQRRTKTQREPFAPSRLFLRTTRPPHRTDVVIAHSHPRDFAAVSSLFADAARGQPWLDAAARSAELAATSAEALASVVGHTHDLVVARRGREVVGACLSWDDGGGLIWLATIAVVPEIRRQGIARRLIDEVAARAFRGGHHRLWCMTLTANTPANAMLAAIGFTRAVLMKQHAYKRDCYVWCRDIVAFS